MPLQPANRDERTMTPGAAVYSEPGGAVIVLSGRANVTVEHSLLATVGPGHLIVAPPTGPQSAFAVTTVTSVRVLDLDPGTVVALLRHPLVAAAILNALADVGRGYQRAAIADQGREATGCPR